MKIVFHAKDLFGRKIVLTLKQYLHIIRREEMKGQEEKIKQTLKDPDEIRRSVKDKNVLLFYKYFLNTPVSEKYLVVVVKVLNNRGNIITSYFSDRIKKGEIVWKGN